MSLVIFWTWRWVWKRRFVHLRFRKLPIWRRSLCFFFGLVLKVSTAWSSVFSFRSFSHLLAKVSRSNTPVLLHQQSILLRSELRLEDDGSDTDVLHGRRHVNRNATIDRTEGSHRWNCSPRKIHIHPPAQTSGQTEHYLPTKYVLLLAERTWVRLWRGLVWGQDEPSLSASCYLICSGQVVHGCT